MTEFIDKNYTIKLTDGILFLTWHTNTVEYHHVDEGIKKRLLICNGKSYPMVSDIRSIKNASKDAKKRVSELDGEANLTALAVIYEKSMFNLLIRAYQLMYRTNVPTKYFTNIKKATDWLEQFKNK